VVRVPHRHPPSWPPLTGGVLGRWPYNLARWRSRRLHETLRSLGERLHPELCCFANLHVGTHHDAIPGCAVVLRAENAESEWMARFAASRRNRLVAAYAAVQQRRLVQVERRVCESVDLVLAIQARERDLLRTLAPRANVEFVPVAVDFARFETPRPVKPPVVLLAGAFTWKPNVEGALRFLREGWPVLRARAPDARLRVAGKQPPLELRRAAASAGVELAADVPTMAAEMAEASVMVVPLWTGGGARVKVVEALAAGLPVVSTPLGCEGLELLPGTHLLVGEEPGQLAGELASLLEDPGRARAIAAAGYAFASERFELGRVAGRFVEACAAAVLRRARDGGRRR
jgi:glycosyltransferase involved in cell wall biosynthesis